MGAVGLKTHIWSNNFKSILLLIGFPILLIGILYCVQLMLIGQAGGADGKEGMAGGFALSAGLLVFTAPLALIASGCWYGVAYFANNAIVAMATGSRKVERREQPELYNLLENLTISRGMRMPDLRIVETGALNAFASGLNEKQYRITVTRGLLQTLNRDEVEAVLAHELTHIINRDVRLTVIAGVFAGIISLIAQIVFRVLVYSGGRGSSRSRSGGGGGGAGAFILIGLGAAAVGWVLSILIQMALSRRREYMADAGSVELTKNPDAMISALRKIEGRSRIEAPEQIQALFLDDESKGFFGLFGSHPTIAQRVAALVKFAGGRDDPINRNADAPFEASPAYTPMAEGEASEEQGPWTPEPSAPAPAREPVQLVNTHGKRGPWG